jgi:hypothetical protein
VGYRTFFREEDNWENDQANTWPEEGFIVEVQFFHRDGRVSGRVVTEEWSRIGTPEARTKIVLLDRGSEGSVPAHEEKLWVFITNETKHGDPAYGALFVKRILPKVEHAAKCGRLALCRCCEEWTLVIRNEKLHLLSRVTCPKCSTLHQVVA